MRRVLGVIGISVLAVAALVAGVAVGTGNASVPTANKATIPTINVTATDFKFKLSKASVGAAGKVKFKVTNKGKIGHDFKINNVKTKLLSPGKTQTITVNFKKKGRFAYLCTVTGHARLGMQGTFAIAVKPITTTSTTTTTTGSVGNANTTVNVNMVEYAFQLSQSTVPSGKVTFVVKNSGNEVHNFDVNGVQGGSGALLAPGATGTFTVSLAAGQYLYTCDVPFHVDRGMTGNFQVTP